MERARPARGGILIRVGAELAVVPAASAVRVVSAPVPARIAGAPRELVGIALFDAAIVPVVLLGTASGTAATGGGRGAPGEAMIVCSHEGELLGLIGMDVVRAGVFPADPLSDDGIMDGDRPVPALDVAAIFAHIEAVRWTSQWG